VAGARRGQLALLDQADDLLASKIDALARADAKLDVPATGARTGGPGRAGPGDRAATVDLGIYDAAQDIFSLAGDLERWLDEQEAPRRGEPSQQRTLVREIRERAARVARHSEPEEGELRAVALDDLVTRAVASVRPTLGCEAEIEIDGEPALPPVPCDPIAIEQVVAQLLRNAVEASASLMERPRVAVSLRRAPLGVEIAVEDRGVGLDSSEVDEVFDPFFGERSVGIESGFGLPVCLRIVERHGGELRIESGDRSGTRVSILLPEAGAGRAHDG
jgi:signal transduction histidine kinase